MAKMDNANNLAPILHVFPENYTATITPAEAQVIDIQGYEGCTFIIQTGEIADGTWTITFFEGDAADDLTVIAADDYPSTLIGDIPGPFDEVMSAWDNKIYKVGYIGDKQFVRILITLGGGAGDADLAVSAILGDPHSAPVSVGFA